MPLNSYMLILFTKPAVESCALIYGTVINESSCLDSDAEVYRQKEHC